MKLSFITTVLNEEKNIEKLMSSMLSQTKKVDEIIIVDGGSTDATASVISNFLASRRSGQFPISNKKSNLNIKILIKKGNRSVGRNEAIKHAKGDIILCSDAGCILDIKWVENISRPFSDKTVDVVAGYYGGMANSIFEKCLLPYVLVMPDRVDASVFLPASRSMGFRKSVWKRVGGFPQALSHNEDYVFAKKLKDNGAKIIFQKDAVVYWTPRKTVKDSFIMFFRFALGDAEAGILRPKVALILLRYVIGVYLLTLAYIMNSHAVFVFFTAALLVYIIWSIQKNYKYVKEKFAILYLPLLQIMSDIAVMIGSLVGFLKHVRIQKLGRLVSRNKGVSFIIAAYAVAMLSVINWGIPHENRIFTYQMDEWHQLQAVNALFTRGSPNVEGAANGSVLHFFLSGLYLIPFFLLGVINPLAITSSVSELDAQQRLFYVLRLNTLFFGVCSIVAIAYIAKKYFSIHPFLPVFLFTVNPIWMTLSNYFKYDIALIFWILLSMMSFFRYATNPTVLRYIFASIVAGLSFSVKISAIPMIGILVLAYILFTPKKERVLKHVVYGVLTFTGVFFLFGIPDLLLGKGNINEYLYDNLVRTPRRNEHFMLGMHYVLYLFTREYSSLFGRFLYIASIISIISLGWILLKKLIFGHTYNKLHLFIFCSFLLFALSLIPLRIEARGNRMLVLLPFIVLIVSISLNYTRVYFRHTGKLFFIILVGVGGLAQLFESFAWQSVKLSSDPREISSAWIQNHIPRGTIIGIENIPIYQRLPDVITREYYQKQKTSSMITMYTYVGTDSKSLTLPKVVVLTNDVVEVKYLENSPKKDLLKKLEQGSYIKAAQFYPNLTYYKFIGDDLSFYFSNLVPAPVTTTIYSKL